MAWYSIATDRVTNGDKSTRFFLESISFKKKHNKFVTKCHQPLFDRLFALPETWYPSLSKFFQVSKFLALSGGRACLDLEFHESAS